MKQPEANPRRLTPAECRRLMGFPDDLVIPVSDAQAYRQFGNAVVPAVVRDIAKNVVRVIQDGQDFKGEKKLEHVEDPVL